MSSKQFSKGCLQGSRSMPPNVSKALVAVGARFTQGLHSTCFLHPLTGVPRDPQNHSHKDANWSPQRIPTPSPRMPQGFHINTAIVAPNLELWRGIANERLTNLSLRRAGTNGRMRRSGTKGKFSNLSLRRGGTNDKSQTMQAEGFKSLKIESF